MNRHFIAPLLTVMLTAACSAAPPANESPAESESEALCGNGLHPGCGDCYRDPSSRTGGSRTCWTCDGDTHTQTCAPPPVTIPATWSGKMWIWTPKGPTQGAFSLPVQFTESGTSWTMSILQSTVSLGVDLSIAGSGPVSGDNASLTLNVSASGTNATVNIGTTSTITPPGQGTISGVPFSSTGASFQMVGSDASGGFKAFLQGTITGWP